MTVERHRRAHVTDAARVNRGRVAPAVDADEVSLKALMDQYAGPVYRVAFRITRNKADAEEVLQDVFFAVGRKIDTFQGRCALGTWLYRICINAALNKRRGKRFDLETSLEQLPRFRDGSLRAEEGAWASAEWSETPDRRLLRRETLAVVIRALDALPDHYRAVIILRDVEQLPNADIAEVLQESEPSVKSRLHRARLVLRERLHPFMRNAR